MTVRCGCVFLVVLAGLTQASPVQAQGIKRVIHSIILDTKRDNCWPKPFVLPDRQSVRAPIELMVAAGWQRQNLLGDYHFDEDTGELTEAGKLKVRWIAGQVPSQHQTIFVSRAASPKETEARMDAVRAVAEKTAHDGNPPRVLASGMEPSGWPASRVDVIGRKFQEVMPEPKLPEYDPNTSGK